MTGMSSHLRAPRPLHRSWDMEQAIEQERLRLLASNIHFGLLISIPVAMFLVWGLTGFHPQAVHLIWLGCMVLVVAGRYWSVRRALARAESSGDYLPLRQILLLGGFVGGCTWGAAGVLFIASADPLDIMLVTIILGGVVAGALATHSYYFPSYFAFAVPTVLPLMLLAFAGATNPHFLSLGMVLLLYLIINLFYSSQQEKLAARAIRLELVTQNLLMELRDKETADRPGKDTDPLTGMPDRRHFEYDLASAWRALEGQGMRLSLILAEVAGLERHRRKFGQASVDAALRILAGTMEGLCLKGLVCNTPARIGNNRFAILLHTDEVRARRMAEELHKLAREAFLGQGLDLDLTVAVASLEPDISKRPEQLIRLAEKRLEAARQRLGRHRRPAQLPDEKAG